MIQPPRVKTRITLCGRLSVEVDGVWRESALRGRQVPLLLAYLLLHRDRLVGREELAAALWPRSAPASQDAALRTLLSRLRSALPGARLGGREELSLELPEPLEIDLEQAAAGFAQAERALADGRAHSAWMIAREPLRIAGRGLLPGVQADWLEPHRRELAELRAAGLECSARAALALGGSRLVEAQRAARALIDAEPYRESGWALLIEALIAAGNPAEGLRAFERLRMLLREELGATPSAETVALHDRLLHGRSVPGSEAARVPAAGAGAGAGARPGAGEIPLPAQLEPREGPLVGRAAELASLWEGWQALLDGAVGARRVMLLSGDPGIGKTRLAAELALLAARGGAIVLAGRAPQEALIPYQPLVEALRHYVANAGARELRRTLREHGVELIALVPELARRLPELAGRLPELGRGAADSPEAERYRMFEAFVAAFEAIAARAPLLLVLDDLHWADRATLLLLRHLARAPALGRVAVLGAYRFTEAAPEPLTTALSELRGQRLVMELVLAGLDESDTAELARSLAGAPPSRSLVEALHARTEGNPYFVGEIIRHLQGRGVSLERASGRELGIAGLPQGVRDVIARRLGMLHRDALECLQAAAVIGHAFETAVLEQVVRQPEERFLSAVEAALEARLLSECTDAAGAAALRFSNALTREVLYEGMSSVRRAGLHRRVGEVLGALPPGAE
jgi:DNA-binding SARP family transcriptional activator